MSILLIDSDLDNNNSAFNEACLFGPPLESPPTDLTTKSDMQDMLDLLETDPAVDEMFGLAAHLPILQFDGIEKKMMYNIPKWALTTLKMMAVIGVRTNIQVGAYRLAMCFDAMDLAVYDFETTDQTYADLIANYFPVIRKIEFLSTGELFVHIMCPTRNIPVRISSVDIFGSQNGRISVLGRPSITCVLDPPRPSKTQKGITVFLAHTHENLDWIGGAALPNHRTPTKVTMSFVAFTKGPKSGLPEFRQPSLIQQKNLFKRPELAHTMPIFSVPDFGESALKTLARLQIPINTFGVIGRAVEYALQDPEHPTNPTNPTNPWMAVVRFFHRLESAMFATPMLVQSLYHDFIHAVAQRRSFVAVSTAQIDSVGMKDLPVTTINHVLMTIDKKALQTFIQKVHEAAQPLKSKDHIVIQGGKVVFSSISRPVPQQRQHVHVWAVPTLIMWNSTAKKYVQSLEMGHRVDHLVKQITPIQLARLTPKRTRL